MEVVGFVPMDAGVMLCTDCADMAAEGSAVFDSSETDSPSHCDECGALIPESLTTDGVAYVAEALASYVFGTVLHRGHVGSAAVLDEWRAEYGAQIDSDAWPVFTTNGTEAGSKLLAIYDALRERQQSARSIILAEYERGHGRSYGTGMDGEAWTTFEHDSSESTPDECSECGTLVHSGWLCLDGGEVACAAHIVTTDDARETASHWHGGQTSDLYALSSTGIVGELAAYELKRLLHTLDDSSRPTTMTADERRKSRNELRACLAYCDGKSGSAADRLVRDLAKALPYVSTPGSEVANAERFTAHVLGALKLYGIGEPG
jgi:hypothetical protein